MNTSRIIRHFVSPAAALVLALVAAAVVPTISKAATGPITGVAVAGPALEGANLTATVRTSVPVMVSWQWRRCAPAVLVCEDIDGARAATYRTTPDDLGQRIAARAIVVDATGTYTRDSRVTAPLAMPLPLADRLPALQLAPQMSFTWRLPVDDSAFLYDIQQSSTRVGAAPAAPAILVEHLARTDVQLPPGAAGTTICMQVRARDRAGNTTRWSTATCTTSLQDDRGLVSAGAPASASDSAAYGGTLTLLNAPADQLTSAATQGRAVNIVTRSCATCGTARVRFNGAVLGYVNLRTAAGAAAGQKVTTFRFSTPRTGTVSIDSTTPGAPVQVDAVAVTPA